MLEYLNYFFSGLNLENFAFVISAIATGTVDTELALGPCKGTLFLLPNVWNFPKNTDKLSNKKKQVGLELFVRKALFCPIVAFA